MKANVRPTILVILLLIAIACSPAGFYPAVLPPAVLSQATAEERRTEDQPLEEQGSLVIIGGGLQYTQNDVWSRIVELAGGEGAKIAVFPTASSDPAANGSRTIEALRAAGGDAFLVPVRLNGGEVDYRKAVTDPELIDAVKTAGGVYFVGGSQERITQALGSSEGNRTPMLDAIWDLYHRGGVVAGSSAGAAVMSRTMYRYSRGVLATLEDGVQMGRELAPGLGFLHPDWFVEQHCLARGRFGRALVAMQTMGLKYGVGVDENTAVVVRNGRDMSVIGAKGADRHGSLASHLRSGRLGLQPEERAAELSRSGRLLRSGNAGANSLGREAGQSADRSDGRLHAIDAKRTAGRAQHPGQ